MTDRLPVEELNAKVKQLDIGGATTYHLPNWHSMSHPERLSVIRQIATMRGRDPRIAKLCVDTFKRAHASPRQYKKQAASLLDWVQTPKNFYYVNEPGERLQDPIYSIEVGHGDCFAENTLVLRDDFELVQIQDVRVGDRIWGKDRWSTVEAWVDKGVKAVDRISLNNGSTLMLTGEHKVYVRSCPLHGPSCKDLTEKRSTCINREFTWKRIPLSELDLGMHLLTPESIDTRTSQSQPETECRGAEDYIEDGRIPTHVLAGCIPEAIDKTFMAASQAGTVGIGWTFPTKSYQLAVQYRVLQRMQGRSTSINYYRGRHNIGVRFQPRDGKREKQLKVASIERNVAEVPTYDIQTDDHYVYLPEADCTVSNCDDAVILLCTMFESVRLPWKLVISGRHEASGQLVRYIEGGDLPAGVRWSHIYTCVGAPPFQPSEWYFAEPTIQGVPLGWDILDGDKSYLPELAQAGGESRFVGAPTSAWGSFFKRKEENPSPALLEALGVGTISSLVGGVVAAEDESWLTGDLAKKLAFSVATGLVVAVGSQLIFRYLDSRNLVPKPAAARRNPKGKNSKKLEKAAQKAYDKFCADSRIGPYGSDEGVDYDYVDDKFSKWKLDHKYKDDSF